MARLAARREVIYGVEASRVGLIHKGKWTGRFEAIALSPEVRGLDFYIRMLYHTFVLNTIRVQEMKVTNLPAMSREVSMVFENYPAITRQQLSTLRETIFSVAAATEGVTPLEETLKWGQISYLTPKTKSGSTIRMDAVRDNNQQVALYFNCQTSLVETFRNLYGEMFEFEGNRCVRFSMNHDLPLEALEHCIVLALTYHQNKKRRK